MKKHLICLFLIVGFFSCTKEGIIEVPGEKENFDEQFLSNLDEMSALKFLIDEQKNNIVANAASKKNQLNTIGEERLDYLLQKEVLTENEESEFLEILKILGFSDLDMFDRYNEVLNSLTAKISEQTNFGNKSLEEQTEILNSSLQSQVFASDNNQEQLKINDQPTTLFGCQQQHSQCIQDANDFTDNCVVLCAAGGVTVGIIGIFTGGVLTAAAYATSAACMAGCVASGEVELLHCEQEFAECLDGL